MDLDDALEGHPFVVRDLWQPSIFSKEQDPGTLFPPIEVDLNKIKLDNPYAPVKDLEHDLRLPELETFEFGPLDDLSSESSTGSSFGDSHSIEDLEDDVWHQKLDLEPLKNEVNYFSWEAFQNKDHKEPGPAYVSENSCAAFDAAVNAQRRSNDKHSPTDTLSRASVLLKSLFLLGLGRASILYPNVASASMPLPTAFRIAGCNAQSTQDVQRHFRRSGTTFSRLRSFVEWTLSSQTFPAQVALGSSFSTILSVLEDHLCAELPKIRSLLQLQHLFTRTLVVLNMMEEILQSVRKTASNEQFITELYQKVQDIEYRHGSGIRSILTETLRRVCEPWFSIVAEWVGLKRLLPGVQGNPLQAGFVSAAQIPDEQRNGSEAFEYEYRPDGMPPFFTKEDGDMIFETGRALRFLQSHHPDHPLSNPQRYHIDSPELEWKFSWQDMDTVVEKARDYERSISQAIHDIRSRVSPRNKWEAAGIEKDIGTTPNDTTTNHEHFIMVTAELFDSAPEVSDIAEKDNLHELVTSVITSEIPDSIASELVPPLAATPQLSLFPILYTQSRLIGATSTRLFFRAHDLRHHLQLHGSFHLLIDGVFIARLTSALLDPTVSSAERQRGVLRTGERLGLKLGSRDTWPPASSELRLALAGMLDECYWAAFPYGSASRFRYDQSLAPSTENKTKADIPSTPRRGQIKQLNQDQRTLPGSLGFSIRTLPAAEIQKCLDPHSLQALDFLRLQYTPPSPLDAIITPSALEKFDRIFKFLLRLLRVRWVVERLSWSNSRRPQQSQLSSMLGRPVGVSQCFRLEARHFVQTCAFYFFDTGIREVWREFERWLDVVETQLDDEDAAAASGDAVLPYERASIGIDTLRVRLDQTLDGSLWCLLLRHRQTKVLAVFEDVLSTILVFARMEGEAKDIEPEVEKRQLYSKFRYSVALFLTVCRGLAGKRGYRDGAREGKGSENTIERLVVALEMNGYYSSDSKGFQPVMNLP